MILLATTDQREAKECKEEKEGKNKHCHQEEWNVLTTKIVNICIVQPHPSLILWIFKVGYIKHSDQCAEDLCIGEEDECCQDRNGVVAQQVCKSA